jgi:hypothetical protein
MSRRNRREAKAQRRLRRSVQVSPPAMMDVAKWLMDRDLCDTVGGALNLINHGVVRYESHTIKQRWCPAHFRPDLYIVEPNDDA